MTSSRYFSTFE